MNAFTIYAIIRLRVSHCLVTRHMNTGASCALSFSIRPDTCMRHRNDLICNLIDLRLFTSQWIWFYTWHEGQLSCQFRSSVLASFVVDVERKSTGPPGPVRKCFVFVLNILYRPTATVLFKHGLQLAVTGRYVYFHLTYQFSLCQQQKLRHEMTKQFLKIGLLHVYIAYR